MATDDGGFTAKDGATAARVALGRFTDRARKVMHLASKESMRFNHGFIGTCHILLGLAKEGSGVGANVLKYLHVDLDAIRREVAKMVQAGTAEGEPANLPMTAFAMRAVEEASKEAAKLGHNYVGTEHLLLALTCHRDTVAASILGNLRLRLEDIRYEVLALLGHES
ncbi:MAG TPA: Clp protease N-terminal domain-containing protein [Planctomycetaceae bacterium]|nr:Clp protease N-terminal domain-containing protein [Planctomycetaceae bacterium]